MRKTGIEGYKMGKTKIFLKYFHVEQLAALRKKEVWALEFVKKVCSGHIARVRYRKVKARFAEQTTLIAAMIAFVEVREFIFLKKTLGWERAFIACRVFQTQPMYLGWVARMLSVAD